MRLKKRVKFLVVLAVSLAHVAALLLLSRGIAVDEPLAESGSAEEGLFYYSEAMMSEDGALREFSELLDTAPLFLPTAYNYTTRALRIRGNQDAGLSFEVYPSRIDLDAAEAFQGAGLPYADRFLQSVTRPVWGPQSVFPDHERDAFVRSLSIVVYGESGGVLRRVERALRGPETALAESVWRPVWYAVVFDALGHVGPPRREGSSGDPEIDGVIDGVIADELRDIGVPARGYVRFLVAP